MSYHRERLARVFVSLLSGLLLVGIALFVLARQTWSAGTLICRVPSEYPLIQAAIDDQTCDTIRIAAGTYPERLMITRSVSLQGAGIDATFLDGGRKGRTITVDGTSSPGEIVVRLDGLNIVNGDATSAPLSPTYGGGILVIGGANLLGENLTLEGNLASTSFQGYGGGIAVNNGTVTLTRTAVMTNTANQRMGQSEGNGRGGGIYVTNADFHLIDSQIMDNLAAYMAGADLVASGGGLYVGEDAQVTLEGNLWTSNVARGDQSTGCDQLNCTGPIRDQGGGAIGVFIESGTVVITITNDVFVDNIANNVLTNEPNSGRGGAISLNSINNRPVMATLTGVEMIGNLAARVSTGSNQEGRGGAIYARRTDLKVERSSFFDNQATGEGSGSGGGIYYHFPLAGQSFILNNSLLAGNLACRMGDCGDGAQVFMDYSNPSPANNVAQIVHSTIANVGINPRQGIYYAADFSGDRLYITDTIVASHTVGIENWNPSGEASARYILFFGNTITHTGTAFIDSLGNLPGQPDPDFVDPLDHDYHIWSSSPAIDRGVDAGLRVDMDGDSRPQGDGFDIGADEFGVSHPTKTPTITPSATLVPTDTMTPSPTPIKTPKPTPTIIPNAKLVFLPLTIK